MGSLDTIVRIAYAFALATTVALPMLLLSGSALRSTPLPAVAFIGNASEDVDATYRQYLDALSSIHPGWQTALRVVHVDGGLSDRDQLRLALSKALQSRPSMLVLPTGATAQEAQPLLHGTAAVFATFTDPVGDGIVRSLTHPGPMTGVSLADWLDERRLDLLREAFPALRSIAVLADRSWVELFDVERRIDRYSRETGVTLRLVLAEDASGVDAAMRASDNDADAWYIPPTFVAYVAEAAIRRHLLRLGKPAMFGTQDDVREGGQMAYAQDTSFAMPALAALTLRVLDGERPQDIPVQRPHRFVLAVRISDEFARDVAPAVVRRADVVYHGPAGR